MKLLNSGDKLRYWKYFKQEYCSALCLQEQIIDKQNMDVEAMVKRQIEWMNRQMPQGKIVIEHSPNLSCNSQFCLICQKAD